MNEKKFCTSCGKKLAGNATTCPKCGYEFETKNPKKKGTAVVLAVLFSFWSWLYTYKKDGWKFWVGLLGCLILFWTVIVPFGVWIWSVLDTAVKDKEWYDNYSS